MFDNDIGQEISKPYPHVTASTVYTAKAIQILNAIKTYEEKYQLLTALPVTDAIYNQISAYTH